MTNLNTSEVNPPDQTFPEMPDRHIPIRLSIVEKHGATSAILLGLLESWQSLAPEGQFLPYTEADLSEDTGLSKHELRTAITRLEAAGILEVHRHDIFGRRNFRVKARVASHQV